MTETLHEDIWVISGTNKENPHLPSVLIAYGDWHEEITVTIARARAIAIIEAIALAQTEERIAKAFVEVSSPKPKGFSTLSYNQWLRKSQMDFAAMLHTVRGTRPILPSGLDVIFGHNTQQSLIILSWYGSKIQLDLTIAKRHANILLEAAEAAQTDRWMFNFFGDVGMTTEEVSQMLSGYAEFRKRGTLEDMYRT